MDSGLFKPSVSLLCLLLGLGALAGCDEQASKPPPEPTAQTTAPAKTTATATATAAATTATAAEGKMTPEQAAEKMFPHVEKLAEFAEKHKKDCDALTKELEKYSDANLEDIKSIREAGGGKIAVLRAMETKYGEKLDEAIEKLEEVEFGCKANKITVLLKVLGPS